MGGGTTFSASPAIIDIPKIHYFIVKGKVPWYSDDWVDKDKVTNVDESISGQSTTVTCKDVTDMGNMFMGCAYLTSINLSNFDTSKVTNMGNMFNGCNFLTLLDLSNYDTSKIKYMNTMFAQCNRLTSLDLSSFNTSNVTNMKFMFSGCSKLTTIKGVIDMKSCTEYFLMFDSCPKLKGVKIKNPPSNFESETGLSRSQYTIVS